MIASVLPTVLPLASFDGSQWADPIVSLPRIDQIGLGLASLFFLLGVWRGLWWQVVRLAGVMLAVGLARSLTPTLQPVAAEVLGLSPSVSHGLSWFVLFVAGIVAASLLGLLGKRALEAMKLGLVDRVGGALAGVATGLALHTALLVVLGALTTPEWKAAHLEQSLSWDMLETLAENRIVLDEGGARVVLPNSGTSTDL